MVRSVCVYEPLVGTLSFSSLDLLLSLGQCLGRNSTSQLLFMAVRSKVGYMQRVKGTPEKDI